MSEQNHNNKKLRRQKINVMLNEEERKLITEKAIKYGYGDCLAEYIRAACIYENIYIEEVEGKKEVCEVVSKYIEVIREILNEQKPLLKNFSVSPSTIKMITEQNKKIIEEIDSLQKKLITILSVNSIQKIQHRTKMIDNHRTDAKLLKRVIEYDQKITVLRPSNLKAPAKKIGFVVFLKMYDYTFDLNDLKTEDFTGLVNLFRDVAMKKNLLICFCRMGKYLKCGIVMDFTDYSSAEKYAIQENQDLFTILKKEGGLVGDLYPNNS